MYQYHARRVNMNKYLPEGANNVLYLNFRLSEWRNVANVTLELPSLTPRTRKINVETKMDAYCSKDIYRICSDKLN